MVDSIISIFLISLCLFVIKLHNAFNLCVSECNSFREVFDVGVAFEIVALGPEGGLVNQRGGVDDGIGEGELYLPIDCIHFQFIVHT